jgi:hypothetical protein
VSRDSDRFRHDLAEALPGWVAEGLVSAEQADRLRAHHRLDALEDQAGARMSLVLLVLGASVIGLGIASFVAANWEAIPPGVRVLVATVLMFAADVLGWRWLDKPGWARPADVALVLGAFLLGADLALVAQWFQLPGDGGGLFFLWGLGSLAMAWAVRHVPTASVGAFALMGAGSSPALAPWLPWVFVLAVLPLGHLVRSSWLQRFGVVGLLSSVLALGLGGSPAALSAVLLAVGAGVTGLAAFAASRPAGALVAPPQGSGPFAPSSPARELEAGVSVGLGLLGALLFGWSFQGMWSPGIWRIGDTFQPSDGTSLGLLTVASLVVAIAGWRHEPARRPLLVYGALASGLLALLALAARTDAAAWMAWPVNALLLGLGVYATNLGLTSGSRQRFWLGVALVSAQVGGRFIEFDTGLLLKAAAFIAWGVALIALGRSFEARRSQAAREAGRG